MARRLRVKLNLPLLAANLSKEDARTVTEAEVSQWLRDAGFAQSGEWWFVAEPDLGQIDPSEVLAIEEDPQDRN